MWRQPQGRQVSPSDALISCHFLVVEVWRKENTASEPGPPSQDKGNPTPKATSPLSPSLQFFCHYNSSVSCSAYVGPKKQPVPFPPSSPPQIMKTNTGSLHNMRHCIHISVTCTLKPTLGWKSCSIKSCLICLDLPRAVLVIPGPNLAASRLISTSPPETACASPSAFPYDIFTLL